MGHFVSNSGFDCFPLSQSPRWELGVLQCELCILEMTLKLVEGANKISPLVMYLSDQSFHCRHGKAYLFNKVVNITVGPEEERMMMTGMHTVVDIFCVKCGSIVGWKYEAAHEKSQKYKEGKFILERFKVSGPDGSNYCWITNEAQVAGSDAEDA